MLGKKKKKEKTLSGFEKREDEGREQEDLIADVTLRLRLRSFV